MNGASFKQILHILYSRLFEFILPRALVSDLNQIRILALNFEDISLKICKSFTLRSEIKPHT